MPDVIITDSKTERNLAVTDASHAVRLVATRLKEIASDKDVLGTLQTWADAGFKKKLRVKVGQETIILEYRN